MNKKSFFAGLGSGLAIALVLLVIYTGVQGVLALTQEQGLGVVQVDYESLDSKFQDILTRLESTYYEEIDVDELYDGALKGFVDGLGDPYTVYFTAEEYTSFTEGIDGTYEGIGAYVGYGETREELLITSPMEGSPSEAAGLKPGDRVIKVDDVEVSGMTLEELVKLIKGPQGTEVLLTIMRDYDMMEFTVVRDQIVVPTVSHKMLEDQIGYLRISGFDRVTYDQFMEAFEDLKAQDMQGMILDLRYNGGGLTNIVSAIADELLPEGVIYYTEDKNGEGFVSESDEEHQFDKPLVVLVNEGSASASEILAGAIKDHERGTLVGTQTFGKGLVQTSMFLDDGSALKITIARYFTPDGNFINKVGITPDVISEIPEVEDVSTLPEDWDPQLDEALDVMKDLLK